MPRFAIAIAFTLNHLPCMWLLGELVPKTLALQRAEQIALAVDSAHGGFSYELARPYFYFMRNRAVWY